MFIQYGHMGKFNGPVTFFPVCLGGRVSKIECMSWVVVAYAFNPSAWETEAGELGLQGHPGLEGKFQSS